MLDKITEVWYNKSMTKADTIFYNNIQHILNHGVKSGQARPKYADGTTAHSLYVTGVFAEYDLANGEFPITSLRPIQLSQPLKSSYGFIKTLVIH